MARFLIGHFAYPTKRDATADVRRILHAAPLDQPLTDRDLSLIAALYAMHPRRAGEPSGFMVALNNYHGTQTRGFQALWPDGRRDAFSYMPCLSPATDAPQLFAAMRAAIMPSQREALRAAYASRALIPCPWPRPDGSKCGRGVPLAAAHVHHKAPKFVDIADAFIALIGEPPAVHSAEFGDDFADAGIKRRFVLFHDAVAQRVVVCAACNALAERADDARG